MEACTGDGAKLSLEVHDGRTRDNRHKEEHREFQLSIKKRFYAVKRVKHWNCSKKVVESMSLEIFKLDNTLRNPV